MQLMPGDSQCYYATRTDGGAWSAVTDTRRPLIGVRLSAIDDGSGGGGGGLAANPLGGFIV